MNAMIKKEQSLLLVVDIQERLCAAMEQGYKDTFIKNSRILAKTAKAASIPVIASEQYPKGLGRTMLEVAECLEDVPVHEKLAFSCYRERTIKDSLDSFRRNLIILCGIETHVCVMQTALDLISAGYTVVVAGDAVCSRRAGDRIMSLDAMARQGVFIYPTETIAFMILERAGSELFKQVSPLFKDV